MGDVVASVRCVAVRARAHGAARVERVNSSDEPERFCCATLQLLGYGIDVNR